MRTLALSEIDYVPVLDHEVHRGGVDHLAALQHLDVQLLSFPNYFCYHGQN